MFSGIVSDTTDVLESEKINQDLLVKFAMPKGWKVKSGDSVNTNGVCLSIESIGADWYMTRIMPETLNNSTFGSKMPRRVNLELALRLSDRLDGHIVQGHVDTVGRVGRIETKTGYNLCIEYDQEFENLVVYKGSVTINGVSLTISSDSQHSFCVSLVDYTLKHTTLGGLQVGELVNIEFDIIGKYVSKKMHS